MTAEVLNSMRDALEKNTNIDPSLIFPPFTIVSCGFLIRFEGKKLSSSLLFIIFSVFAGP